MSIYLHIGYPKTATTWLQKSFFPHIKNLKYVDRKDIFREYIAGYELSFDAQKARSFFTEKYGKSFVFSLEGVLGTVHNFGINGYLTKQHATRLQAMFPEAKIILFIRRQPDIIASSYYQYIMGGGTYSVKRYLNEHSGNDIRRLTSFSYKHFEYDLTIGLYHQLFGKENVNVYLYEDFQYNPTDFLTRFSAENHFDIDLNHIDFSRKTERYRKVVLKMSWLANLFTAEKMYNKYYLMNIPYWFKIYKPLLRPLNRYRIFGKRANSLSILGEKNYEHITNYYKDCNQRLISLYNLNTIKDHNYPL